MRHHHVASVAVVVALLAPHALRAQRLETITYSIQIPATETHLFDVVAVVPTSSRDTIELMMPVWSPGYYRVEDYAANVRDLTAQTVAGEPLTIAPSGKNHWRIETRGRSDSRGWASLGLLAHEFVHLYNVKRLRPSSRLAGRSKAVGRSKHDRIRTKRRSGIWPHGWRRRNGDSETSRVPLRVPLP